MIAIAGLTLRGQNLAKFHNGSGSRHIISRFGRCTNGSLPLLAQSSVSNRSPFTGQQNRFKSSYPAALHPTSAVAVPAEGTSPISSTISQHFEPFATVRGQRARTKLPTPLPSEITERRASAFRDHLREVNSKGKTPSSSDLPLTFGDLNTATLHSLHNNDSFFTPAHTVEDLAILRACLATGLVQRASKVFNIMREEVAFRVKHSNFPSQSASSSNSSFPTPARNASPLDVNIYNAMLGTFWRKGYQEDDIERSREWLTKAWQLFNQMEKGIGKEYETLVDPVPDESTFAVMAKGIVRFKRSNRYPSNMSELSILLGVLRRSGVRLHDVLTSSVFTHQHGEMEALGGVTLNREGEPDAKSVMQSFVSVAAEMGSLPLSSELDGISRTMQGMDEKAAREAEILSQVSDESEVEVQIPELRPVISVRKDKQGEKVEGEVNFNLRILRENLSIVQEARRSSTEPYERQHWLEFGAIDAARKRFEAGELQLESIGLSNAGSLQQRDLQRWMWGWYKKLETVLQKDIQRLVEVDSQNLKGASSVESKVVPFLQLVAPGKLAMITILELMRLHAANANDGMKTTAALISIGKAVEREHYASILQKNADWMNRRKAMHSKMRQGGLNNMQLRRELQRTLADDPLAGAHNSNWSTNIRARVGSYLVQHLMNVATVKRFGTDRDGVTWDEEQAAFFSAYQYVQGKKLGVIRLNEVISHRLARESALETLHPRHLPMLVPPNAWIRYDSGGYLSVRTKAVRFKDDFEQASYLKAASENGSLEYVLSGLDVLGSTAWTINRDIFKIVTEVWNSGKSIADMPPLEAEEEEPIRPDNYDTDMRARSTYLYTLKQFNLAKRANHAQRCEINYRLEIARAFLNERFYFPHNMDFRGRAYPIPPYLNHIGNDLSRGLMLFADAKPLGKVGLRWLRIHLANVYGYDKASFSEREQFAIDHEEDMRKSVADPLGEEGGWWLQADDPWQCLATCMELVKALDHPEGPELYQSQFPVHQDGTCNGLQHYAALGGDMAGAEQVNLKGKDRPSDVYTAVADLVIDVVKRDAEAGDETAMLLEGKISRKVVKQTVMTTVYGVTFIGAKAQVARQLVDRGLAGEHIWKCSAYLAKRIMGCIGDLFSGAEAIQNWLKDSALLIAKSIPPERLTEMSKGVESHSTQKNSASTTEQMTSVIWTTPLGLPIVQPYRKQVRKQVTTSMQTIFIKDPHLAAQVSPSKQASAFPPNFIHSLDATHMFLTALECQSAGLTFASVHDSYWTHACDIETMSDIIRDTFVRLHSCDILPKLKEEFLDRYKGYTVPRAVAKTALSKRAKRLAKIRKSIGDGSSSIIAEELQEGTLKKHAEPLSFTDAALANSADEAEEVSVAEEDVEAMGEEEEEEALDLNTVEESVANKLGDAQQQKYILLKDILPEIPARGTFDVNEIKRSLYFFS